MKGLDGSLPARCFCSRTWRCFGFCSTAWRTVSMRSPGMVGGLSGVEYGPAHDRLFCLANPGKKAPSVLSRFLLGRNQLVCSRAETGGSSYACRGDSQRAEPWGEQRQPNWLCRQKVLSYPHRGLTESYAKHRTSNAIFPHPSPAGSARLVPARLPLSRPSGWRCLQHVAVQPRWTPRALPDEDNLCALAQANF